MNDKNLRDEDFLIGDTSEVTNHEADNANNRSEASIPSRLEDLIENYGKEGNLDHGSNSRVFIDEEYESVWKIVPQYDMEEFISDHNVYSEAGIETPTNGGMNADLSEYGLGLSLVVKQDMVEDYSALTDLITERVAEELVSMAESVIDEGYSLDFDITNFGLDNDQIIYLDDADPFSLSQPPSTDKMILELCHSVDELDEDFGGLVPQVDNLMI